MVKVRPSARTLAVVVAGGAVGVALRAAATLPLADARNALVIPAVTLVINVLGSFLLGVAVGRLGERRPMTRAFFGTGVLGGFTTYSAFAVQTIAVGGAAPFVGMLLAAVSVILGVVAAAWGLRIGGSAVPEPEAAE